MRGGFKELLGRLRLRRGASAANYVEFTPSASLANNILFTLPTDYPDATKALTIDTSGNWGYAALGSGGSVTSVALAVPDSVFGVTGSPITVDGTLTITLDTQTANRVWAGPASGSPAEPTFRDLVYLDVDQLVGTGVNTLAAGDDARFHTQGTDSGTTATTWLLDSDGATPLGLKNSSGALHLRNAGDSAFVNLSLADITLSTSQSASRFLASPAAASGAPTWRALAWADVSGFAGTSATSFALGNDARLHTQGTDVGTTSTTFSLDSDAATPVLLKNSSGVVQARNAADSAFADFSGNTFVWNATVTANRFYAGPTTGAAAPSFRALVWNDVSGFAGTSATSFAVGNDTRFHTQGTDLGTTSATFSLDSDGTPVLLKNNAGVLEIRNAGDTAYANIVVGNVTIQGTATTIVSETVTIADNILLLNSDYSGPTPTENAGFEVERGDLTNASFLWDESSDQFKGGLSGAEIQFARIYRLAFTSASLSSNVLTATHGLGNTVVGFQLWDNNGKKIDPDEATQLSSTQISIDCTNLGVTGTWNLVVWG